MPVTLEITSGPDRGRRAVLSGGALRVGRVEPAELLLHNDALLSSQHFALESDGAICRVRDLGSRFGTLLNGTKVTEAVVRDGDRITAGHTTFVVRLEAPKPAVPPPARTAPVPVGPAAGEADPRALPEEIAAPVLALDNRTPFPVAHLLWEDLEGRPRLTVLVKATFAIKAGKPAQPAAEQWPVFTEDQPYPEEVSKLVRFETDLVPFKPRADMVLVGRAHAPARRPVTQLDVTLRVGTLSRTLRVFGDRQWQYASSLSLIPRVTATAPFVTMDLTYERAFGGIDGPGAHYCKKNLAGTGIVGKLIWDCVQGKRLPNVEDPRHLIDSPRAQPNPAGFGFYGRGWAPRLTSAGTYDDAHRRTRAPALPADFSYAVFNGAHPDLQVEGYLKGDEPVELENLSVDSRLAFQLPGVRPRITVVRWTVPPEEWVERQLSPQGPAASETPPTLAETVPAVLDTLVLVPDEGVFYEVFRGACVLSRLDVTEIAEIRITL